MITNQTKNNMKKYKCSICGYVYDPEVGDSSKGIAAGTAFEDLPADWRCPVCGAPKSAFKPIDQRAMQYIQKRETFVTLFALQDGLDPPTLRVTVRCSNRLSY